MLEKLKITGAACFGATPLELDGLKQINFFFGSNGSGKTTISRALDGYGTLSTHAEWHDGAPLAVKVYNRDFVDRMLKESDRIPGVFVIGESSVEAQTRLQEIEGENGERAKALDALERAKKSLQGAQTAHDDAEDAFRESAWEAYKNLTKNNPALEPAFKGQGGIGNSKPKLMEKLLALPESSDPIPVIETLVQKAEAVFNDTATRCEGLPKTPVIMLSSIDGYELLGERIVGSEEVSLSELISRLGNSDWVSIGRQYLEHSNGVCPFCQKEAPANLLTDLATMFDEEYALKKERIEQLENAYKRWSEAVAAALENFNFDSRAFLDEGAYQAAMINLRTEIDTNLGLLRRKLENLSESVELVDLSQFVTELDLHIESANAAIRDHNELVSGRRDERPKLVEACWQNFAYEALGATLATFKRKQSGRATGITTLVGNVAAAQDTINTLDEEVRGLQKSVRSSQPVIDRINELLNRNGFTSFKIVRSSQLQDGYMLSRDNGAVQEHSLSEGERTFIAFLYYFHLLDEQTSDGKSHRILAVIDDPVSSLDADVLFVVGALIRRLIARALGSADHIEQLLLLTHNVYFHKDVSHVRQGESEVAGRKYYVIRKRHDQPSEVVPHLTNPITTEYRRLWDEVKRAVEGEQINVVGLENILRRILESYFRVMGGGIWDDEITPLLDQSEQHVFKALFRWANEGSHSILEELYYAPTAITQDVYLSVFKRIFEVTDHGAHYRMMIEGKRSLPADR